MNKLTYGQLYDSSGDQPVSNQVNNPALFEFVSQSAFNRRTRLGQDLVTQVPVGDAGVVVRGTKQILWSSEGYTNEANITIAALTSAQKFASGNQNTNIGGNGPLDISSAKRLNLVIVLSSLTGTSLTFEMDFLDDAGTPNVIPIWNSSALTSATKLWIAVGPGLGVYQASAAPNTGATGLSPVAGPTGWTTEMIAFPLLPNLQFKWTAASLTAASWTAFLYAAN